MKFSKLKTFVPGAGNSNPADEFDSYFDDNNNLISAIEALIFSSDGRISLDRIFEIFGVESEYSRKNKTVSKLISAKRALKSSITEAGQREIDKKEMVLKAIDSIKDGFNNNSGHGIYLSINDNELSFKTKPEYHNVVSELLKTKPQKFTKAQLETLSIIAYRQPVIKSEIDSIRGVDSGGIIRFLLEKGLVKTAGRKNIIGKPLIYKTTGRFLEVFNLNSLDELPSIKEVEGIMGQPGDHGVNSGSGQNAGTAGQAGETELPFTGEKE